MRRLAALALSLLLAAGAARAEGAPERGPLPDWKAGELRSLIAARAHLRPTVVHFWATWCEACREEFPRLRPVLLDAGLGASVLLLAVDERKDARRARWMLQGWGLGGLPAWRLADPDPQVVARVLEEPGFDGTLPATLVLDAKGRKVRAFVGRTEAAALRAAVAEARR